MTFSFMQQRTKHTAKYLQEFLLVQTFVVQCGNEITQNTVLGRTTSVKYKHRKNGGQGGLWPADVRDQDPARDRHGTGEGGAEEETGAGVQAVRHQT